MTTELTLEQAERDIESALQFVEMCMEDEPDAHVPLRPDSLNQDIEVWTPEQWEIIKQAVSLQAGVNVDLFRDFYTHGIAEWPTTTNGVSLYAKYEHRRIEYWFGKTGFWH